MKNLHGMMKLAACCGGLLLAGSLGCRKTTQPEGLVFFTTAQLDKVVQFYADTLDFDLWQSRGDVRILHRGTFFLGLHRQVRPDTQGLVSIVLPDTQSVNRYYKVIQHRALFKPRLDTTYHIYHFLARDPEKRLLELQYFDKNDKRPK